MAASTNTSSTLSRGYTLALLSAAFLSTTAIFIRYLTQNYHIPSLVLAFWRDVFVVVVLAAVMGVARPKLLKAARKDTGFLLLFGLVLAFFNAFWTLSVAYNGASVATVLAYSSVAFTAVLGWWFLKERLGWIKGLAVLLSLGGCFLVSGALDETNWSANLIGITMGILSGLCYALYSLMGRTASQRGINPWTTLLYTFGFAAIILLAVNLIPNKLPGSAQQISDLGWLGEDIVGWGILFLLAAVPTLGGFGLYNVSLSYLSSSSANLVLTSEPVFTTFIAYILLGERLNPVQIIGSVMVLGGVILIRIYEGRQDPAPGVEAS